MNPFSAHSSRSRTRPSEGLIVPKPGSPAPLVSEGRPGPAFPGVLITRPDRRGGGRGSAGSGAAFPAVLGLVFALTLGALALLAPAPLAAQVGSPDEALEEIRSLAIRVDLSGSGADASLAAPLQAVIRQELERVDILRRLREPRPRDCCELRLDVRLVSGTSGVAARTRGGLVAYSARLELGLRDQVGRIDSWILLWTGRTMDDLVDPRDLQEQLRFATRELTVEFADRYLELFPIR
jgi:hypothetical protein